MGRTMRLEPLPMILLVLATVAVPPAEAHGTAYPSPLSSHTFPLPTVFWVTYNANHIVPGVGGTTTINIFDASGFPVAGFACQDRDGDNLCGASVGELQVTFCNAVTLTDLANLGTWDPTFDLFVYQSTVGCPLPSAWTTGTVTHTP